MRTRFPKPPQGWQLKANKRQARLVRELTALSSVVSSRAALMSQLGKTTYGGYRDIYSSLGYLKTLTFDDLSGKYARQDIAKRIVNAYPDATWRNPPEVYEDENSDVSTAFEKSWKDLLKQVPVFSSLKRIDRIAGIGQYGVLFLGLNDGIDPKEPVVAKPGMKLLYLQPYSQDHAKVATYQKDKINPRYGFPETYTLTIVDSTLLGTSGTGISGQTTSTLTVHWSRVIHIADDLLESNYLGTPRLESVWNRLEDIERVVGGSSEMFWRGAFSGLALEMDKDAVLTPQGESDLNDEVEEYIHSLTRVLRLQGMKANSLTPVVSDPKSHLEVQISLISGATGIPQRILLGSERGELASTTDNDNWNSRVDERRKTFAEPQILRTLIDRLILFKVLPSPAKAEYQVDWPDLQAQTAKEIADIGKVRADALAAYVNSGSDVAVPLGIFLSRFLGLSEAEAREIEDQLKEMLGEEGRDSESRASRSNPPGEDSDRSTPPPGSDEEEEEDEA